MENKLIKKQDIRTFGLMEGLILSIGLFACLCVAFGSLNPDLYFILNNGRYIVQNKDFFPAALFSTMHNDLATVIQQPLWSVIIYFLFHYFGIASIPILSTFFAILSTILLFKIFKRVPSFFRACLVTTVLLMIFFSFSGRPSTLSIPNMLFSVYILENIKDGDFKEAAALILIPVSILELLCHAAFFPILLSVQATYLLGPSIKNNLYKFRFLLISLSVSMILSALTPYGVKLPFYLFYSYGLASQGNHISELQHPDPLSYYSLALLFSIVLLIRQISRTRMAGIIPLVLGVFALIMHKRNLYLLGVLIIPVLKDIFCTPSSETAKPTQGSRVKTIRFALPLLLLSIFTCYLLATYKDKAIGDSPNTPVVACRYLLNNDISKNVYSDFNMGAFVSFCGIDSYIDARPELFYKKINNKADIYSEYIELSTLKNYDYNGFIAKYRFCYLITDNTSKLHFYLENRKEYEKILDGNGYSLYKVNRYEQ